MYRSSVIEKFDCFSLIYFRFYINIVQYSLKGKYTNSAKSTTKTQIFQDKHGQRIKAVLHSGKVLVRKVTGSNLN